MVPLTETQRKVVEFIFEHSRDTGMPPTLREICAHLGWNAVGSAQDVVSALRKKGYLLQPEPGKSRQIVLSPLGQELCLGTLADFSQDSASYYSRVAPLAQAVSQGVLWVPLLGQVQAGASTEAIEQSPNLVPFQFTAGKKSPENFFALTVEGYSMLNAGFLPGDVVLVERSSLAKDGDIVVAAPALGEATVKRFAIRGSQLFQKAAQLLQGHQELPPALLLPENPVFEPIPFGQRDDARILGLVRALIRPVVQ
jgi:repressor LexA